MKPIFKGFLTTTYTKAFILNSISVAISTALGIEVREWIEYHHPKWREQYKMIATLLTVFLTNLISFIVLHRLFGFGGSMLV